MRQVHNIESTVPLIFTICRAHSNGLMDMFQAKSHNSAAPVTCIPPVRWDANQCRIRIEILASKI